MKTLQDCSGPNHCRGQKKEPYTVVSVSCGRDQGFALFIWGRRRRVLQKSPNKATARFPAPIGPKSRSMPAKDGVRLNNASQTEHAWPEPGHEHQQRSVTATQCR